jgi:hypothetical protein
MPDFVTHAFILQMASEYALLFMSYSLFNNLLYRLFGTKGACCNIVVKLLCYKPEGRGFETRRGEFLNLPNPSGRSRPWGLLSL